MRLVVSLGEVRVGEIATSRDQHIELRFAESYKTALARPVLGQVFEDDLDAVYRTRVKLHTFFSNLLPEGALRALVAEQIGVRAEREPDLIAHLGDDLPGAVRVAVEDPSRDDDIAPERDEAPAVLKFSLAGVQLKLSAVRDSDRGLTIPTHGRGGDWIVKLPGLRFVRVPENEWSMMTLARDVGLDVAEVELVPIANIRGLPPEVATDPAAMALAVRRFDRISERRIHIEDFAQVLDVRTPDKYKAANFETIGRNVVAIAPASAQEFFRRVVFIVAMGNGDAHLKNWSLIYRDGVHAALSPAYDLVSTIEFIPSDDLGLNLSKSKAFSDVDLASLERFARRAGIAIDVRSVAGETVERIRARWTSRRNDLPMSAEAKRRIDEHWKRVPLMRT